MPKRKPKAKAEPELEPTRPPRPEHVAEAFRLTVTIRGTHYDCRPADPVDVHGKRAWSLRKADGTGYTVADGKYGATCDCASFTFRHDGLDAVGCKHIRALRALGLLDPAPVVPEDANDGTF
jgi:hypothetical protein